MTTLLEVGDLTVRFGGVFAVHELSFAVQEGEICGLIGPNGAGKTTLFNAVTGNVRATSGRIVYDGTDVLRLRSDQLARLGIRRTFQNLALFETQDVHTNVLLGAHVMGRGNWLTAALRIATAREERELNRRASEVIELLGLGEVAGERVSDLPFGTLKRVELARALVARPRLLLLDEPANGLRQGEVKELREALRTIREEFDVTIVLVDHHVGLVMSLCDSVVAMAAGRLLTHGAPAAVRADATVRRVFLGGDA